MQKKQIWVWEEEQQKVENPIALKTPEQEGAAKGPEDDSKAKSMTNAIKDKTTETEKTSISGNTPGVEEARELAPVARKVGKLIMLNAREDKKTLQRLQETLKPPPPKPSPPATPRRLRKLQP